MTIVWVGQFRGHAALLPVIVYMIAELVEV